MLAGTKQQPPVATEIAFAMLFDGPINTESTTIFSACYQYA